MGVLERISHIWFQERVESETSPPLYRELYELLKLNIENGNLPRGNYLASSRELAVALKLSRSTVNRAYELLVFDGLVSAQLGKGYIIDHQVQEFQRGFNGSEFNNDQLSEVAQSFLKVVEADNHEATDSDGLALAFRPGVPPVDIFPVRRWMSLTQKYWKDIQFSSLNYKATSGVQSLKETIANYLRIDRNMNCHPDQIIVVSGSLQSLYLIANTLINPGDKVFLENPTFQNVVSIFKGMRANLGALNLDADGAQVPCEQENNSTPKLAHLTPSCHFPLGMEMSDNRKKEWVDFACTHNCYLIENDYEHEIVHYKREKSTLFSLDTSNRTIYLSTFNRLLHPSIRIGYMVVPFDLLPAIEALMNHSHRFVPPSIQMVLNEFIKQSFLQIHIKNVWQVSNERRKAFLGSAKEFLPDWQFDQTNALHILGKTNFQCHKPGSIKLEDDAISRTLREHNIVSQSLSSLYFEGPIEEGLILGYSSVSPSVISQKIQQWSLLF